MPKRSRQAKRVQRVRWWTLGGAGTLVAVVAVIGLYSAFDVTPGEYREGEHYLSLVGGESDADGPIVITEFFSYGCVHCRNFDPQIEAWKTDLPEGAELARSPVSFNAIWRMYAKMYYMAEELDVMDRVHDRLFADIHDRNRTITSEEQIRKFFVGVGVAENRVARSMRSPAVARKVGSSEALARAVGVRSVPTLMIGTKYIIPVGDVGRLKSLAIADHLIEKEMSARESPESQSPEASEADTTE